MIPSFIKQIVPDPDGKLSRTHWILLVLSAILFVLLRVRWLGHLLVWDEAMTLCTVRAFKAGAHDAFSDWFWRHPPLYTVGMLLLAPFRAGFAERAELFSIFIGLLNQLLLFILTRRVFGVMAALWSAFFLAVMPGSVFFDVWIKQDHPVATFGLLALILLFANRPLYAGLCLGLALLAKETAIFYALTAGLLWLVGVTGKRNWKDLIALTLVPALVCGWWYLIVVPRASVVGSPGHVSFWSSLFHGMATEHLRFATRTDTGWENPWHYYFSKLPLELGWLGIALAVAGFVVALCLPFANANGERASRMQRWWPLSLLVPAICLLSLLHAKVPWIVIALIPAWASLQGLALAAIISFLRESPISPSFLSRAIPMGLSICVIVAMSCSVFRHDYETILHRIDESQWRGASYSREAAELMNKQTHDGERALVTSFHYWKGYAPGQACPIFACYFVRKVDVLLRPHDRSFQDLVNDIKRYRLDWALLSPEAGDAEREIFSGFDQKLGPTPYRLPQAFLYRTTPLYLKNSTSKPSDP